MFNKMLNGAWEEGRGAGIAMGGTFQLDFVIVNCILNLLDSNCYDNGITLEGFRPHTSFGRFLVHNLFIRENLLNRNVSETK